MIALVLRRLGWALVVAWFVATATFAMVMAIPADPATALLGPHATPETIASVRAHYCLDDGVVTQYGCWLDNVVRGDLGQSYRTKRDVLDLLGDRAWPTAQLAVGAIALALLFGLPLGVAAAVWRRRWFDRAASVFSLLAQSAPAFVVGALLVYVAAYRWGLFPIAGYGEAGLDRLHHLALPALALATFGIAYYARVTRAELGGVLETDYIRTARAKGLTERSIVWRHALRPAAGPLVTVVGLDLGVLLGGAVVVESIFAWPGLGREALQAILDVDVPVILGIVLVSAIAVTLANLVVDLVLLALDPRLRD